MGAAVARGVEPTRCRDIIQDAVRRARRKASMLAHLDSSLLLSTLEVGRGPGQAGSALFNWLGRRAAGGLGLGMPGLPSQAARLS